MSYSISPGNSILWNNFIDMRTGEIIMKMIEKIILFISFLITSISVQANAELEALTLNDNYWTLSNGGIPGLTRSTP